MNTSPKPTSALSVIEKEVLDALQRAEVTRAESGYEGGVKTWEIQQRLDGFITVETIQKTLSGLDQHDWVSSEKDECGVIKWSRSEEWCEA